MNTTIIIIGFIAIAVSVIWGTKFKTNVGIAALVFAFLLGLFGLGMKASDIYAFWPARTTVQLIIVSYVCGPQRPYGAKRPQSSIHYYVVHGK